MSEYDQIRQQIIEQGRAIKTRDDVRAARRRTGLPKPSRLDKTVPVIPIREITRDESTSNALRLLENEKRLYAIAEIKERPFYITSGDVIRANRMNELKIGDVIKLDRVTELGGKDHVIKGNPYVHPSYFTVEAVVIEHVYEEENVTEKRKKRGKNTVRSHRNARTMLRVRDIKINEEV
jgi:ribosomal protein L21